MCRFVHRQHGDIIKESKPEKIISVFKPFKIKIYWYEHKLPRFGYISSLCYFYIRDGSIIVSITADIHSAVFMNEVSQHTKGRECCVSFTACCFAMLSVQLSDVC